MRDQMLELNNCTTKTFDKLLTQLGISKWSGSIVFQNTSLDTNFPLSK